MKELTYEDGINRGVEIGKEKGRKELADKLRELLEIKTCYCDDCTKD